MTYDVGLPASSNLNIADLSRVFDDKTNSYKYIFFLSMLDILKRRSFDATSALTFRELVVEMLANAWFPYTYFKLSFGLQDKIIDVLDSLQLEVTDSVLKFTDTDKQQLRKTINEQKTDLSLLMRYVPFRFLRPFMDQDLKGVRDAEVNNRIRDRASHYDANNILYIPDKQSIKVHQRWANYFMEHYAIIRGWVAWEWLKYMQIRNPNVPAISNKLFPPQGRASLNEQKKYWKVVIENAPIHCIFSKERITENSSLDHYLPWSFVAHDQLWNLIPTLQIVNSSKSNNLPASIYHQDFISLQHLSLITSRTHLSESVWNKYTEPYILDLKISNRSDLLRHEVLCNAYESVLESLATLAKGQGFAGNWVYRH